MSFPIANPDVYLNYLTPSVANDYELVRDFNLVTFGALFWDILSSMPEDYRLIRTRKSSVTLFAYFVRRPTNLVETVIAILQYTGPITNCGLLLTIAAAFQVISSTTASYLFLKRVHTIYCRNKIVTRVFSFLWLVGVGMSCAVFYGAFQDHIEIADTKHCFREKGSSVLSVAFMDPILFDTLVYIAITWKILTTHHPEPRQSCWKTFLRGEALPRISRALLQSGQQYHLITMGVDMVRFAYTLVPSSSPTAQVLLADPASSLTGVMACRVYRNLIIRTLDCEVVVGGVLKTPVFAEGRVVNVSLPMKRSWRLWVADLMITADPVHL
ncbi:hypothetical protein ID866_9782 [Astraeus odoratus]|nr:hypothetical protein ID866_9782 [Astraeus odoratus]